MGKKACANQAWVDILTEEMERQFERDPEGYAHKNIKKAINSFMKCPEQFERPSESSKLQGVGTKTIAIIERGIKKREASGGDAPAPARKLPPIDIPSKRATKRAATMPSISSEQDYVPDPPPRASGSGSRTLSGSSSQPDLAGPICGRSRLLAEFDQKKKDTLTQAPSSSNLLDDLNKASKRPSFPSKPSSPEEAVTPDEGSPESALLIALYEKLRDGDRSNWAAEGMSATELQARALPYVSEEYLSSGIIWHTKGLDVNVRRRFFNTNETPVLYSFTMAGLKIAHSVAGRANIDLFDIPDSVKRYQIKLSEKDELDLAAKRSKNVNAGYAAATGSGARTYQPGAASTAPPASKPVSKPSTSKAPEASSSKAVDTPFEWYFISRGGLRVKTSTEAEGVFGDDKASGLLYKIEYRASQASHPSALAVEDAEPSKKPLGPEGKTLIGWSYMKHIKANAPGFTDDVTKALGGGAKSRPPLKGSASAPAVVQTKRKRDLVPTLSSTAITEDDQDNAILVDAPDHRVLPHPSNQGARLRVEDLVVMRPNEYRIVLVLDHRERQTIKKIESSANVEMDTRALSVADAIWIAKRNVPTGNPEVDELVLDVAVERKRLSDLVESIKSHRYDDQKIRMKTSGITRLLYLLENDRNDRIESNWEQQIWTVKSQTQVLDGFGLLVAANFQKMVAMHTRLTHVIQEMYRGLTIYGIRHSQTNRRNYLGQLAQLRAGRLAETICPTFVCYQELNDKQRTVYSEWAAMMFAQVQMSGEKVQAFIDRFPTPISFWEAITARRLEEEEADEDSDGPPKKKRKKADGPDMWVMNEAGKGGSRGIKQKISSDIYNIWTQTSY